MECLHSRAAGLNIALSSKTPEKVLPYSPSSQRLLSPKDQANDSCGQCFANSRMSSEESDIAVKETGRSSEKRKTATLNAGTDEELIIEGYRYHSIKAFFTGLLFFFTAGLTWLMLNWIPKLRLKLTHETAVLSEADTVLIEETYKKGYTRCYVKKVYAAKNDGGAKQAASLPAPLGGGNFKTVDSFRFFRCKKHTYAWDVDEECFYHLKGLDHNVKIESFHRQQGLDLAEQMQRQVAYGLNDIQAPDHSVGYLLVKEVLNPFYVFQLASTILWVADEYYYYAAAIILMSFGGISSSVYQTRQNQKNLRSTVQSSENVTVRRKNGDCEVVDSKEIVPGDVIVIPSNGCELTCDAVLISGTAIVNESMLTGESVPVTKTTITTDSLRIDDETYDHREHQNNTLFRGTTVIQTRNYRNHQTVAVVIRTGFFTAKGNLVRSILYPSPVDYKFEEDSYKFVGILILFAVCGFVYTTHRLVSSGTPFKEIFLEAADLFTIVIPPALPAAITIGSIYAEKRLKRKGIFCISPRSINLSGSVDCVCFDKTGTLTEDGLDLLGVVRSANLDHGDVVLRGLEKDVSAIPVDDAFIRGMATCHSLTVIDGDLAGDPLDVIMFEGTAWILEEQTGDASEQYDNLYPTVVKPPAGTDKTLDESDPEAHSIGIIRQFQFTSEKQCMSVIVRGLDARHFTTFCKGSPEKVRSVSDPATIPSNFQSVLDGYAERGFRVIALAMRVLPPNVTYRKVQRVQRNEVEKDLEFLGLLVLENRLKKESVPGIAQLRKARLRTVMVTGDHIQTAVSVAKECKMFESGSRVIFVNAIENKDEDGPRHANIFVVFHQAQQTEESAATLVGKKPVLAVKDVAVEVDAPYGFAVDGASFELIRKYFPQLMQRLCVKGIVFARMSPQHKELLVEELKILGYNVGMCGDGANDCGALKAAHAGISLSEAESSVASPFTSKEPNISCVPELVREGRCALVTSFGIFKYMAAYSMTQYISVIIVYEVGSNLSDFEFLYIDLFLITVFAFFFGLTKASEGELAKEPPKNSLFDTIPITSMVLQLLTVIAFQTFAFEYVKSQDWFVPFNASNPRYLNTTAESLYNQTTIVDSESACWETHAVFSVSSFQYILLAYAFSKSKPYRQTLFTNHPLMTSMIALVGFTLYLVVVPSKYFQYLLELFPPPAIEFTLALLGASVCNIFISVLLEDVVVEMLLAKSRFSKLLRKKPLHEIVQVWLENNSPNWPPISDPPTGGRAREDFDLKVRTKVEFEVMDENEAFETLFLPNRDASFKPDFDAVVHQPVSRHSDGQSSQVLSSQIGSFEFDYKNS